MNVRAASTPAMPASTPRSRALVAVDGAQTIAAIEQRADAILADVRAPRRRRAARIHAALRRAGGRHASPSSRSRRTRLRAALDGSAARRSAPRSQAAADRIRHFHERQHAGVQARLELPRRRRHPARPEGDAARPRRHLRAGRQGGLSVVGADERDSGAGRGRRRDRHGRADAGRRAQPAGAGRGLRSAGVDARVHDRRRAGDRRARLRHARRCRRSTRSPGPATPMSPRPSGASSARSAST